MLLYGYHHNHIPLVGKFWTVISILVRVEKDDAGLKFIAQIFGGINSLFTNVYMQIEYKTQNMQAAIRILSYILAAEDNKYI